MTEKEQGEQERGVMKGCPRDAECRIKKHTKIGRWRLRLIRNSREAEKRVLKNKNMCIYI